MATVAVDEASSPRRGFHNYVQTVSTCDDLLERENAVLRAQVHDLTELLAAFDLCELQDGHLKAVRDRAFRRDIAPDRELLQVYRLERWQQQKALFGVLNTTPDAVSDSGKTIEDLDISRTHERDLELLRQRVDVLERDVGKLCQRNKLLERSSSLSGCPNTEAVDLNKEHLAGQDERVVFRERLEVATKTIRELHKTIAKLEKAMAAQLTENALHQKQNHRYNKIVNALAEF